MAQERILYLDAGQLTAYRWQHGMVLDEARFRPQDDGLQAFGMYLRRHPGTLYHLLSDVAEEGFQFESVPHVRGSDRRAMVERKLAQYFYGSPLTLALPQGRDKKGRRDEHMLFAALTRPQMFEPWLILLRAAQARVAGIYSLPLVSPALLERAAPRRERCLLLTIVRGGIRQSFFERGQLRFSRLSPLAGSSIYELASACATESVKIYQYLVGQRLIARGMALPTLVMVHPAHRAAFAERCRDSEELRFELLDLHAVGRHCGLKSLPPDSFSDALFMHLLVRRPPAQQFAPAAERRFFRLWQARSAILGGGAAVLAACLLWAGARFYEATQLREDTSASRAQALTDQHRYQALMEGLPAATASLEELRAVEARFLQMERRSAPVSALLGRISRALDDSPRIRLERIEWSLGTGTAAAAAAPPTPSAAEGTAPMHAAALLSGTLDAEPLDQRGMIESVNAFVTHLRAQAGLEVTVTRMPVEIESGRSLRGGGDTSPEAPRFAVRVAQRLQPTP